MIEQIYQNGCLSAIIIRANYHEKGIHFCTPEAFTQQMGYLNYEAGHIIIPHQHIAVKREVEITKEVLFIRSGKVRVDFYDEHQLYLESTILNQGDVILLAYGGHGFEMLENSEIIEVKQGPFFANQDKIRFIPAPPDSIKLRSN